MKQNTPQALEFFKYHGAGNDFIIVDNRFQQIDFVPELVSFLCNRHLGIGADGLIRIELSDDADFSMIYHNSDGLAGSMCGNGGRSAAAFALESGISGTHTRFQAFDGMHEAWIEKFENGRFRVKLSMADVKGFSAFGEDFFINTGSPHYVKKVEDVNSVDVLNKGREIRYDKHISADGVNVNFVEQQGAMLRVRTYERGVEAETLSCGTGVTAAAIANYLWNGFEKSEIYTKGGVLHVSLRKSGDFFTGIFLEGPVQKVFSGNIILNFQ
ncbi:MAG TPA: diaminopimelate epimerase [Bacteroidales bacterium]|nr:diaminopimelate epimerase [Bacteroidales bacterium]